MPLVIYRSLKCHCGFPALLLQDELEALFRDPDALPNDLHAIGVVCPYCRQIDTHFLEQKKDGPIRLDKALLQELDENMETVCESIAQCEEPSCKFLLPIVLQVSRDLTDADYSKLRAVSKFEGLVCPNGHPILKPVDW